MMRMIFEKRKSRVVLATDALSPPAEKAHNITSNGIVEMRSMRNQPCR